MQFWILIPKDGWLKEVFRVRNIYLDPSGVDSCRMSSKPAYFSLLVKLDLMKP
jgi:hypothetical protein